MNNAIEFFPLRKDRFSDEVKLLPASVPVEIS